MIRTCFAPNVILSSGSSKILQSYLVQNVPVGEFEFSGLKREKKRASEASLKNFTAFFLEKFAFLVEIECPGHCFCALSLAFFQNL